MDQRCDTDLWLRDTMNIFCAIVLDLTRPILLLTVALRDHAFFFCSRGESKLTRRAVSFSQLSDSLYTPDHVLPGLGVPRLAGRSPSRCMSGYRSL